MINNGQKIQVWRVPSPSASYQALYDNFGHWLDAGELERLCSQRTPKGSRTFLLTRIALRAVLSQWAPDTDPTAWRFQRTSRGRPTIMREACAVPDFNLSHADDALVIAVASHGRVGVDVESTQRAVEDPMRLAQKYFHEDEAAALLALPEEQRLSRFLVLWTLKEACVKATGQGLANTLQEFSFDFSMPPHLHCDRFDQPAGVGHGSRQLWRAWSGLTQFEGSGDFRLSLVWQGDNAAAKGDISVELRELQFTGAATSIELLFSRPPSGCWPLDWVYPPDQSMYSSTNLDP